jgi:two-component system alkaline phosphatase synthesis response regulator PhoP
MSKTILIVEDEAHIRKLLLQVLEELEDEHEVNVLSAGNGAEGLEMIRQTKPDLVFLDIMMPLMNGYEVCQAVTSDQFLAGVKIILLTAKGQEVDRRQGFDAGATLYMTKPFDPDEVLKTAARMLDLEL